MKQNIITEKGIVSVETTKNGKRVFTLPQGMHGELWAIERKNVIKQLKSKKK